MPFLTERIHTKPQRRFNRSYGTKDYPYILYYFRGTPKSIVCPHFWELRWAYGCPYECAYCYLQGTFRGNKEPRYVPLEHVLTTLEYIFKNESLESSIFNSGELADSLMNPKFMERIADKFEEQNKHKLLLLTKGTAVDFLVRKPRRQTIVSFSLNCDEVWRRWEHKTPPPKQRIKAAKAVFEAGYEVRIRIDPIFPVNNWRDQYSDLISELFDALTPERITLGTPRGLAKTLMFSKDRSWAEFFSNGEKTRWGLKLNPLTRKEIYSYIIQFLTDLGFDKSKIAICKETKEIWAQLRLDSSKCRCNCVW